MSCPIQVIVGHVEDGREIGAKGIGDAVMGLLTCAGLKAKHPGREVVCVVFPWQVPWVSLFGGYDRLTTARDSAIAETHLLDRTGAANKDRWPALCGVAPVRPPVKPLPEDAVAWAEPYRGAVVLSPFSLHSGRNWLLSHWLRLEQLLREHGERCVVIDGRIGANEPRDRCKDFASPVLMDEPPARVAALLSVASCAVSCLSAIAHVAGALGVPCVVVTAQERGEELFHQWPTVRAVQSPLVCSGCNYGGPHYRPACNVLCAGVQAVTPEEVGCSVWRQPTLAPLILHLEKKPSPVVVETGCQRAPRDYTAGMFTSFIGGFLCRHRGGMLVSVDNTPDRVEVARKATAGMPVSVALSDSVDFLRRYHGPPIDALYLDSLDFYLPGHAEHALEEARAALPHLAPDALVLIDDCEKDGRKSILDGKGRLAAGWLLENGFRVVRAEYQVLLARR